MRILNKKEFKRKWLSDNSVKSYIGSNSIGNLIDTTRESKYIKSNGNIGVPLEANTQDKIFKELMFDVADCRRSDILTMPIEKIVDTCTRLISKEDKPSVNVSFTFGDMVKRYYTEPIDTLDVTTNSNIDIDPPPVPKEDGE